MAFGAEEEGAVGGVVHEEVFGEDGGAGGVAEEVEAGFEVGVGSFGRNKWGIQNSFRNFALYGQTGIIYHCRYQRFR